MKSLLLVSWLVVVSPAFAVPATSQTASLGLTSTRSSGTVSIQTDAVLSGGRLIMKVAALNASERSAELSSAAVQVFMGTDKPVKLLTVEQLITEARGGTSADRVHSSHHSSNYSRPTTTTTRSGETDVSGVTGSGGVVGHSVPQRAATVKPDPTTAAQVEALKAGILQSMSIAPGQAAGAQVVTEKLKFARKEPRVLRVIVTFNGESHEFEFESPPAK